MDQQEAQQEFGALRRQQQECLEWLQGHGGGGEISESTVEIAAIFTRQYDDEHQNSSPSSQAEKDNTGDSARSFVWCCCSSKANQVESKEDNDSTTLSTKQIRVPLFVQQTMLAGDTLAEPVGTSENSNGFVSWTIRGLRQREVQILQANQCTSADWGRVYLCSYSAFPSSVGPLLRQRVRNNHFKGVVVLGLPLLSTDANHHGQQQRLQPGLHGNSTIRNCWIQLDACLHRNGYLNRVVIGSQAEVFNVSQLTGDDAAGWKTTMAQTLGVGPESGEGQRSLEVTPFDTMVEIGSQVLPTAMSKIAPAKNAVSTQWSFVAGKAMVRDAGSVQSVFLHAQSSIQGAGEVKESVLFPTARISRGCSVSGSYLQWNVTIQDGSFVENALLMEHCHVGPHSKVGDSILGPDTAVASGEVQCSVLGPNFAAHHQSLVISVMALHGRGNIGYGANVGSNHTGRAPDQEAWSGEGVFWGLSSAVVFPVNLLHSPYSIVAADVKVLPQRLAMPFSLILNDNEVVPAWVWTSSTYTLARALQKYATRRQAERHYNYTGWSLLDRADVLQQIYQARHVLQNLDALSDGASSSTAEWHNVDGSIPSLGRCKVSEKSRQRAIQAYTDCLQRSALHGLLDWIEKKIGAGDSLSVSLATLQEECRNETQGAHTRSARKALEINGPPPLPTWPWTVTSEMTWQYQKFLLGTEFGADDGDWLLLLRSRLAELEDRYVAGVHKSKHRDGVRSRQIIPNDRAAVDVGNDKVVQQVQQQAQDVKDRIGNMQQLIFY